MACAILMRRKKQKFQRRLNKKRILKTKTGEKMTALYRKYRSKSLDDIVGQPHITSLLKNTIKSGRISHAYLFTGPRGVGKTSIARILAHEINKLVYNEETTHLDIVEIDAASNNSVEDVRDLREKVRLAPSSAEKKIYIIDEVHMLSKPAFNALLKTLEEPPEHVVFILATTDADKLPATVISRTQRFSFRAISPTDAVKHLRYIADEEKIVASDEALEIIADRGEGSFRDSISMLDQLAGIATDKNGITAELVRLTLGLAPKEVIDAIISSVESHDISSAVSTVDDALKNGISPIVITDQLLQTLQKDIAIKPNLLGLFDGLLDVRQNPQAGLKLISVLASSATKPEHTKTAALSSAVKEVSASVESLKNPKKTEEKKHYSKNSDIKTAKKTDFSWNRIIEYTKKNHVALFSVLSKCDHRLYEDTLEIYAKNSFYKKKLDDSRYSSVLHKVLKNSGFELTVHTIATALPPKDSQAASVAAIMGGGEEVSLDSST